MSEGQLSHDPNVGRLSPSSPTTGGGGPTVLRLLLGTQLRRLREQAGVSREAAGDAIRASHAKISRLELGRVGFKQRDVADLLTMYGITDAAERETFFSLARQANAPGWWHRYADLLPPWFEQYLGLEEAASMIRSYELQFVPGLFQTEDYARAVTRLGYPGMSGEEADRRVSLRMTRHHRVVRGEDPPKLWTVVDEAALRRPLGGSQVMRGQLELLIELADLPNLTLQVMPFLSGGHAAAGGPFIQLRFTEPDLPDVVYLEQLTSALYLEKSEDIEYYTAVLDSLAVEALPPAETQGFLNTLIKEL